MDGFVRPQQILLIGASERLKNRPCQILLRGECRQGGPGAPGTLRGPVRISGKAPEQWCCRAYVRAKESEGFKRHISSQFVSLNWARKPVAELWELTKKLAFNLSLVAEMAGPNRGRLIADPLEQTWNGVCADRPYRLGAPIVAVLIEKHPLLQGRASPRRLVFGPTAQEKTCDDAGWQQHQQQEPDSLKHSLR